MTSEKPSSELTGSDDIDFRAIFESLYRKRIWLAGGLIFGLISSSLYTLRVKPIWKGEFEIILAAKQSGLGIDSLIGANFSPLAGLGARLSGDSELDTEVKVLESPSVLMPVFEMVKEARQRRGVDTSKMQFRQWTKKNLKVKLNKGTTILQISYLDSDKNAIIPVLEHISKAYQSYSGRDRLDSILRGISYAQEQASIFKAKALDSNRALDAFAIRYGISRKSENISSSGIDVSRLLNSGRQNRGGTVANLGPDATSGTREFNLQGDPLGQLASINQELIRRRKLYTDKDPSVQALIRERDAMRQYIETTGGGMVALPVQDANSKSHTQEIVLRYQELEREAKRNSSIYDSLARTLLSLQLEQARITKPWELISKPSLLDKPVSPKPLLYLLAGGVFGLFAGCIPALIIDKRQDIVYSVSDIQELIPYPLIAQLTANSHGQTHEALDLIARKYCCDAICNSIALIEVSGARGDHLASQFESILERQNKSIKVLLTGDIIEASKCDIQMLIVSPGFATRKELQKLHQLLELQGKPVAGLLVLDHAS